MRHMGFSLPNVYSMAWQHLVLSNTFEVIRVKNESSEWFVMNGPAFLRMIKLWDPIHCTELLAADSNFLFSSETNLEIFRKICDYISFVLFQATYSARV